jgi:hypothetical protein
MSVASPRRTEMLPKQSDATAGKAGFETAPCLSFWVQSRDDCRLPKTKRLGSMEADELRRCLAEEVATWCRRSYSTLRKDLEKLVTYTRGEGPSRYEVEVRLLENKSKYLQIGIAVDDGHRAYRPLCHSFLVYKDGRADRWLQNSTRDYLPSAK